VRVQMSRVQHEAVRVQTPPDEVYKIKN
jgi:hypothetical protein